MEAATMMNRLAAVIDAHDWTSLAGLLHEDFVCRLVHTAESFDRDAWVRLNIDYPGFERFVLHECVASGDRAAGRSHVTGRFEGELAHFEVATFITVRDSLIAEMTEVWADVGVVAPKGTRPGA